MKSTYVLLHNKGVPLKDRTSSSAPLMIVCVRSSQLPLADSSDSFVFLLHGNPPAAIMRSLYRCRRSSSSLSCGQHVLTQKQHFISWFRSRRGIDGAVSRLHSSLSLSSCLLSVPLSETIETSLPSREISGSKDRSP